MVSFLLFRNKKERIISVSYIKTRIDLNKQFSVTFKIDMCYVIRDAFRSGRYMSTTSNLSWQKTISSNFEAE